MSVTARLGVEELAARNAPSGSPFGSGAFLPSGLDRAYPDHNNAPPPAQVGRDASVSFLPPGLDRAYPDHNNAPPPAQVGLEGAVTFLPPAAATPLPS